MNVLFIYNPESGKGRINKNIELIKKEFIDHGYLPTIIKTNKPGDAKDLSIEYGQGYDLLICAGGDGTLSEVVNGLMTLEKRPTVGYIPTGTTNDLAHMLGLPRKIKKALRIILKDGVKEKMDISEINNTYFTYAAATGKFAKASYDVKKIDKVRFGHLAYVARGIKDAFVDYKMPMKITYDGGVLEDTFGLILVLNGPRVGGVNLFLIKKSKLNDGVIEAKVFRRRKGRTLFTILSFFGFGGFSNKYVKTLKSPYYEIQAPASVEWNTDGEKTHQGTIKVKVHQEALEMIVSKRASKQLFIKK